MTTTTRRPPQRPAGRPPVAGPPRDPVPWVGAAATGIAVLLAGAPVTAVVQGGGWFGSAVVVVLAVIVAGLVLHRLGPVVVAVGQGATVLLVLTALFAEHGTGGIVPGPAALGDFGALITAAGDEIAVGVAPVPGSPGILFLVTTAFGLITLTVYAAVVGAAAPAAAGVPLLALFAVPAALADDLLPWWTLVGAAAGFGLLLMARDGSRDGGPDGARRRLPGGAALVAGSVAIALLLGAATGFIGTSGRFNSGAGSGGAGGSIGLSPFTSLRGQLDQSEPAELFRVSGLPQAAYLRALTLRDYVPNAGWQATRPEPGGPLPGRIGLAAPGGVAPKQATVDVENVGFRDYWLPLYGTPLRVDGVTEGQWQYDARSGTAYTARPREESSWQQETSLAAPTAAQLRTADGGYGPGLDYLNVTGVDPRVTDLARQVVAGRTTAFDKIMALQEFFTGPDSQFRYSLATAPGAGDDALVEFLTVGKVGYCEQFASAMAVMLRAVGIPARVAVGFTGGQQLGDRRSISTADAHAWVEAWFPGGYGWTTFDPTPLNDGRTITPPYVAEAEAEASPDGTTGDENLPARDRPDQAPTTAPPVPASAAPTPDAPASDAGSGVPAWPFVVLVVLVLVVLALLAPAGLRARERRRRLAAAAAGGSGAARAAWAELLAESADRGVASPPSDTVRAGARRLVREHQLDPRAQQALRDVVGSVEASWYGGTEPQPGEIAAPLSTVREAIAASRGLTARERLLPRSVEIRSTLRRLPGRVLRRPEREPEREPEDDSTRV